MTDHLAATLDKVRTYAVESAAGRWPELCHVLGDWLPRPTDPQIALPLATAVAVGAELDDAIPFAAAWALVCFSVRVLDDCADQDNPRALHLQLGIPRAGNLGTGGLLHAGRRSPIVDLSLTYR